MARTKTEVVSVEIDRAQYEFALYRVQPALNEHLRLVSIMGARGRHHPLNDAYTSRMPTPADLAVAAYLQGMRDVAQLMKERGNTLASMGFLEDEIAAAEAP